MRNRAVLFRGIKIGKKNKKKNVFIMDGYMYTPVYIRNEDFNSIDRAAC